MRAKCEKNGQVLLIFANLFKNEIEVSSLDGSSDTLITNQNRTVRLRTVSTIYLKETDSKQLGEIMNSLNARDISIYQSPHIYLTYHSKDNPSGEKRAGDVQSITLIPAADGTTDWKSHNNIYVQDSSAIDTATAPEVDTGIAIEDIGGKNKTNFIELIPQSSGAPIDLRPYLIQNNHKKKVTIVTNSAVTFTQGAVNYQFPDRPTNPTTEDLKIGTTVSAISSVAFTPDSTSFNGSYSEENQDTNENKKYYRNANSDTEIEYNVYGGSKKINSDLDVEVNDMLGINPWDENTGATSNITTLGRYDATRLAGSERAVKVRWKLHLRSRHDGYNADLEISKYISDLTMKAADDQTEIVKLDSSTETEWLFEGTREDFEDILKEGEKRNIFKTYIDFDVKTGTRDGTSSFETTDGGLFYANYRMVLSAELYEPKLDESGNKIDNEYTLIAGSSNNSDHVTFTNACIDPSFVENAS